MERPRGDLELNMLYRGEALHLLWLAQQLEHNFSNLQRLHEQHKLEFSVCG